MKFRPAVAYIGLVSATGAASLGYTFLHWQTQDWVRYLFYCAIALVAARMRVLLPGITGNMSMTFLFGLVRIAELSLAETMVTGWVAQNETAIVNGNPSVEPEYLNDTAKFSALRTTLAAPPTTCGVRSLYHQDRDLEIALVGRLTVVMESTREIIVANRGWG